MVDADDTNKEIDTATPGLGRNNTPKDKDTLSVSLVEDMDLDGDDDAAIDDNYEEEANNNAIEKCVHKDIDDFHLSSDNLEDNFDI